MATFFYTFLSHALTKQPIPSSMWSTTGRPTNTTTLFLKTRKRKAPMERLAVQPTGRKKKRSEIYKQRVETETSHISETPEREQNSTSESSEDPDRILVEKVIIPVSDTAKQDPVKQTSALTQPEMADDCCREL